MEYTLRYVNQINGITRLEINGITVARYPTQQPTEPFSLDDTNLTEGIKNAYKVKYLRIRLGLTQKEVGILLNKSKQVIYYIEKLERNVSDEDVRVLEALVKDRED